MELQPLLDEYIQNPDEAVLNWNLAQWYEYNGQLAAALSYYIRTAERSDDKKIQYESLIRGAECYYRQNMRNFTVRGMLQRAITLLPKRPEAYWLYSKLLGEVQHWDGNAFDSYTIASIALEICDFDLPTTDPLMTKVGYEGKFTIYHQKAYIAWHCGLCDESRIMLQDLLNNWELPDSWRNKIQTDLANISNEPHFVSYTKDKYDHLKFKFKGAENIEQNYSEAYQDMFVLSMLDGKRYGTYLEIGAGNSFYGSNTALLEQGFDWQGIGLDIDEGFVEMHGKERKNHCYLRDATTTNYRALLESQGFGDIIDYLQIDVDPAEISYKVLLTIPFEEYKFRVITFEHDHYIDQNNLWREKARMYLEAHGYILIADNISPDDNRPYEDWYVHPNLIEPEILNKMKMVDGKTKMGEKYILNT